jgi:hypothetical protein
MEMPDGSTLSESLNLGEIKRIKLPEGQMVNAKIHPGRSFDVGLEKGHELEAEIMGGIGGVILDGRGRPMELPVEEGERRGMLRSWFKALGLYPEGMIEKLY